MSTNRPEGVVPSDISVQIFVNIINQAYEKVAKTLVNGDYSTRIRRNEIIKQLDDIVANTDGLVKDWIRVEIPTFYEMGLHEANKTLSDRGSEIRINKSFAQFHKEAIQAISEDAYQNISKGMRGILETGNKFVSMGARQSLVEKIATGRITGDTRKQISDEIKKTLQSEGITSLTDRAGRNWSLERYGDMLARTKLTQAHNTGTVNRMLESGYDLVMVSSHNGACELCRPFEGRVLSVSGRNQGFMSYDSAVSLGLFHPNCRHVITPYHSAYLDQSVVWDTDLQKYVPYKELEAKRIQITDSFYQAVNKSDVQNSAMMTVFRAEDSKGAGSTLGVGKYFAFEKDNVTRYGKDIKEYYLDPNAKMLELKTISDLNKFDDEVKQKYGDRLAELIDKEGEKGIETAFTEYARKLGYDGIVSDDKVFGSVVFNDKLLLSKSSSAGKKVAEFIESTDLRKYEVAFNKKDVRTLEMLRTKYPEDARFNIHLAYGDVKLTDQAFRDIVEKHQAVLEDLGYENIVEFNRLIEKGNKTELKKFISGLDKGSSLVQEMQNLVEFL